MRCVPPSPTARSKDSGAGRHSPEHTPPTEYFGHGIGRVSHREQAAGFLHVVTKMPLMFGKSALGGFELEGGELAVWRQAKHKVGDSCPHTHQLEEGARPWAALALVGDVEENHSRLCRHPQELHRE